MTILYALDTGQWNLSIGNVQEEGHQSHTWELGTYKYDGEIRTGLDGITVENLEDIILLAYLKYSGPVT